MNETLISVRNLKKYFTVRGGKTLKAVDGISFDIHKGETLGLVGESGCGKSTAGRTIVRLYEATGGEIIYKDTNINKLNKKQLKDYTRHAQMIFQDPYASLNPRMTVTDIVGEGIDIHNLYKGMERQKRIYEILELVGLSREHANRFPHEFSGGQRQRIGVARALAIEPDFIVADEPISALDVSIQAQVVNLLKDLQDELDLTYLFIAHDLSVVKYISDKVIVMYLGNIVEKANSEDLYKNPMHPYTQALLSSIPVANPKIAKKRKRIVLEGELSSPINPKEQCRFADRCKHVMPVCREVKPQLKAYEEDHEVACHLYK